VTAPLNDAVTGWLARLRTTPARSSEARARAAIAGLSSPAEAWARLGASGALGRCFSDGRARAFGVIDAPKRPPRVAAAGIERHATPPTMDALLALAADPEGTAEAERAADEIARRLQPWGGAAPTAREWFIVAGVLPTLHDFGPAYSCALWSAEAALEEAGLPVGIPADVGADLPALARACLGGYASWLRAVEHALEVPSSHWPPDAVKFRPFAELENPFEPTLALWSTGYRLEASFWPTETTLRFYGPAL